jgi:hypothetical protein
MVHMHDVLVRSLLIFHWSSWNRIEDPRSKIQDPRSKTEDKGNAGHRICTSLPATGTEETEEMRRKKTDENKTGEVTGGTDDSTPPSSREAAY